MDSKRRPIINWMGCKASIVNQLLELVPRNFQSYFEPFAGSLSLFMSLNLCNKRVFINDMNSQLISMYHQVQKDPDALINFVAMLESRLAIADAASYTEGKHVYIEIRDKFNKLIKLRKPNLLQVAGMLIFLIQTSFSSIIHLNNNGEYTAGYRAKSSGFRKVLRKDAIHHMNRLLNCNKTLLTSTDFEHCLKRAKRGDFVYLDPPYWSGTKRMIKYTARGFTKDDHIRLANIVDVLTKRGCFVMISYGNHPWIQQMYKQYNITIRNVYRCTHQKHSKHAEEMIITNYSL